MESMVGARVESVVMVDVDIVARRGDNTRQVPFQSGKLLHCCHMSCKTSSTITEASVQPTPLSQQPSFYEGHFLKHQPVVFSLLLFFLSTCITERSFAVVVNAIYWFQFVNQILLLTTAMEPIDLMFSPYWRSICFTRQQALAKWACMYGTCNVKWARGRGDRCG